jgi:hypothetical protein
MQSEVLGNSDSLTPGNYSLYVGDERDSLYSFQMVDKSITQMVLAAHTSGTIAFITVRPHPTFSMPLLKTNFPSFKTV